MDKQPHWQDDFARTAAMLDLDLILLHRFVLQLEGEDRQRFDVLINRAHDKLAKLVNIINPTWIVDPDDTLEFVSNRDPGDEQPA